MEEAHTQKSISRFPAPPNSLSPTWKETVILSSLWRDSWKHSRPWAGSWMLCATAEVKSPAASSSDEAERNCILGDVVGGVGGGWLLVLMSVVAGAEPPAKRDKLAIIHKLVAFAAATARQAQWPWECRLADWVDSAGGDCYGGWAESYLCAAVCTVERQGIGGWT